MSKPRAALVLSDIHCGSTYGLLPPGFTTLEGNEVKQNGLQKWLWDCWLDATNLWLSQILGSDLFILIVNGDAMEGRHHKTKEVISPDDGDDLEASIQVLEPLAKRAAATFVVEGTECHTHNLENVLGRRIGARKCEDTGHHSFRRLDLTIAGTRIIAQHHIATSARTWTEATALGAFLANEQLEAVNNGEAIPRVLLSAHRHRFGCYETANAVSIVTPPFQGLTRHGRKVVPSARTRPGIVVLDWRDRDDGELPEVLARTYRMPTPKGVEV
ncbi:MAG TPA: hypothetical protein VD994_10035 [Prosthecobacter sp.]|nr:hypothetical protein [Prosthecobacter sp.]